MRESIFARAAAVFMIAAVLAGAVPVRAAAEMVDTGSNQVVITPTVPRGKTGRRMNVTFTLKNDTGDTWEDVEVGFSQDISYIARPDALAGEYIFPFEVTSGLFDTKHVGTIRAGGSKGVSLSAKVRSDLPEGYYYVSVEVTSKDSRVSTVECVNMWISKSTGTSDEDDDDKDVGFVMGEGQSTPYGVYPNVLDFTINMRNRGYSEAKDVNVSMVLDKDSSVFPFDINEGNYDRNFEKIAAGEVVQLPYSMAIRSDVYTGYYPIKFEIHYRETATGELLKEEEVFWVRIRNKDKDEDSSGEFNENDRTKARIVVDSFETVPETIIAGEPFKLILRMKNASSSIAASNILFSLESEKVDNSAIFTTASGSSSVVVNSLGAGEVTELNIDLVSRAGIDQRSYGLTIKETYDSPEFKNASETVTIDIPIRQIARNTGTMEVMPDSITVGSESNIMFPINNTGKVILYNVMVKFEADSIQPTDTYVGNIKPGETGNVDVMIAAAAPTQDEGKVKVLITYEDENGEVQEAEEKELSLFVTEDMGGDFGMDIDVEDFTDMPAESTSVFSKYKVPAIIGILAASTVGIFAAVRIKKRRKARREEEEIDNEIS